MIYSTFTLAAKKLESFSQLQYRILILLLIRNVININSLLGFYSKKFSEF